MSENLELQAVNEIITLEDELNEVLWRQHAVWKMLNREVYREVFPYLNRRYDALSKREAEILKEMKS